MSATQWEYTHVTMDRLPGSLIETFDRLGQLGWELVTIYEGEAYFKLRVESQTEPESLFAAGSIFGPIEELSDVRD